MPDADTEIAHAALTRDAALLEDVVREAGALALGLFRTELKSWIKGKSSPVSEADIAVNDLIEARLRAATPDYGWLSEESADDSVRLGKSLTWIVDPIDGTRAYLERRDDWSVSIALVANGMPVLGAVFAPASGEFFFATRGQGTRLNGAPVAQVQTLPAGEDAGGPRERTDHRRPSPMRSSNAGTCTWSAL